MKKNAFTLAELMITFAIIGVLTAILIPALFKAGPNEEILKAKKAFNTISRAVESLTNSGVYSDNAGSLVSTSFVADAAGQKQFFCNNLVELINVKKADCTLNGVETSIKDHVGSSNCSGLPASGEIWLCSKTTGTPPTVDINQLQADLDSICKAWKASVGTEYNFATADNVYWGVQLNDFTNATNVTAGGITSSAFYNVICFSTDKLKSDDNVFGVGIRKDGKIVTSAQLQTALEAD